MSRREAIFLQPPQNQGFGDVPDQFELDRGGTLAMGVRFRLNESRPTPASFED
jgi:hypothetical protein